MGLLPLFKDDAILEDAVLYICPIIFYSIVKSKTKNAMKVQH